MPEKSGITLIALIITIIVLVILAAISISTVYSSNIIGFATNGAINYAEESKRENEILDHTASILESAISNIGSMNSGTSGSTGDGGDEEEPEQPDTNEPIDFGNLTDEEKELLIGQYVDYTPVSGTFDDHVGETYNDYSPNDDNFTENPQPNSIISTDTSLKWRILFAEDNRLTLISDTVTNENFGLGGADGYNNGVLLLNNACKAMYSNSSLGATGRNLNIEDIESVSSFKGTDIISDYGKEYTPSNKYYPNIFAQEEGGAPNGTYGLLGKSEQSSYVTGSAKGNSSFKGIYTCYWYSMTSSYMNQKYVNLFSNSAINWLASRCVYFTSDYALFSMFYTDKRLMNAHILYYSHNGASSNSCALRPIVEIDLTKVNVGVTGTGAENDGYSLTLK